MKLCLTTLLGLFLGSIILLGIGSMPSFTSSGTVPAAQGKVKDQGARNHGGDKADRLSDGPRKFADQRASR
jgi:hypothetical protein